MNRDRPSPRRLLEARQGPLADLLVVEMAETLAGEFAGGLMADMGAAVVKIEPESGSAARRRGRALAAEDSLYFQSENRGKFSVCADPESIATDHDLMELICAADAIVEDLGPGKLEARGLTPALLHRANPAVCILRVSPFGQTGPLATERGDDRIAQAFSGMQFVTGFTDRPPLPVAVPLAEYWTGVLGASGLLIALFHGRRHQRGQVVDLALYETALRMQEGTVIRYHERGLVAARAGNENPDVAPANVYRTRDGGWIALSGAGEQPFARLCRTMGVSDLAIDPRFSTIEARLANRASIDEVVRAWIAAHDQAEVVEWFASAGVTGVAVRSVDEIITDAQVRARNAVTAVRSAGGQQFLAPGIVPKLSRTPPPDPGPAPTAGEHSGYLRALAPADGMPGTAATRAAKAEDTPGGALADIRVLDLGRWLAGPVAATILADFGADVIMIELPSADPPRERPVSDAALPFFVTNRNKRSVTVDIRAEPGRAALLDLVSVSDVLVENFRPGTLERWQLGPDDLLRVNPRLVILRESGFGQTGPYASRAAFNPVGLAFGGMTYLGGWPDRAPLRDGVTAGDYSAALFGAFGVLCALLRRDQDGEGQVVDVSLFEPVLRMSGDTLAIRSALGVRRERSGGEWPLYQASVTAQAGDGRFVAVSEQSWDHIRRALQRLAGTAETDAADVRHALTRFIGSCPAATAVETMRRAGLASSVVNSVADIVADPQVRARGNLVRLHHPQLGEILMQGVVPSLSHTPGKVAGVPLAPGSDNAAVLGGLLGYTVEQISRATAVDPG